MRVEGTYVRGLQPSLFVLFVVLPFNFPEIPQARLQTSKFWILYTRLGETLFTFLTYCLVYRGHYLR